MSFFEHILIQSNSFIQSVHRYKITVFLQNHPHYLRVLDSELGMLINTFNTKEELAKDKLFINTSQLGKLLVKSRLYTLDQVNDDLKTFPDLLTSTAKELSEFDFLYKMNDNWQLTTCLYVAAYRTYYLNRFPELRKLGAQVASAVEEASAYARMQGIRTNIFYATKHWLLDWNGEGFSKDLSNMISKL